MSRLPVEPTTKTRSKTTSFGVRLALFSGFLLVMISGVIRHYLSFGREGPGAALVEWLVHLAVSGGCAWFLVRKRSALVKVWALFATGVLLTLIAVGSIADEVYEKARAREIAEHATALRNRHLAYVSDLEAQIVSSAQSAADIGNAVLVDVDRRKVARQTLQRYTKLLEERHQGHQRMGVETEQFGTSLPEPLRREFFEVRADNLRLTTELIERMAVAHHEYIASVEAMLDWADGQSTVLRLDNDGNVLVATEKQAAEYRRLSKGVEASWNRLVETSAEHDRRVEQAHKGQAKEK